MPKPPGPGGGPLCNIWGGICRGGIKGKRCRGGGGIPGGRWSGIKPGRAPRSPVEGVCNPTTGAGGGATP